MPGLDPRLVAHTLNVDPEARPVAQPARIFHTEIEGQIVSNIVPMKKKNEGKNTFGC